MKRKDVLQQLRKYYGDLFKFKVKSLAIFGSVARNETVPESDVDILVEFEGQATFDQYMDLKNFLEDLLGCPVDLLTHKGVRSELRPFIEREIIYVS